MWAGCDTNTNTNDPAGKERRRKRYADHQAHTKKKNNATSKAAAVKQEKSDSNRALAAMVPVFAALTASGNGSGSDNLTSQNRFRGPRSLLDSGPSSTYTTLTYPLRNTRRHRTTLQTATGATTKTSETENMAVSIGHQEHTCRHCEFQPSRTISS